MADDTSQFPARLRVALRSANVRQREAATVLGISQPALADKLNGRRPLMVGEGLALAAMLGADVTDATATTHRIDELQAELQRLAVLASTQIDTAICALETPEPVPA
jgi:predicted transcriptional regulator